MSDEREVKTDFVWEGRDAYVAQYVVASGLLQRLWLSENKPASLYGLSSNDMMVIERGLELLKKELAPLVQPETEPASEASK